MKLSPFHRRLERTLPAPLFRFLRGIEFIVVDILLQKIFGTLALFTVYFLVLGPSSVILRIFFRHRLFSPKVDPSSNWVLATKYDADMEKSFYQS